MKKGNTRNKCCYLNIRASDYTPFYVGKGTYSRSRQTCNRTFIWKSIANKHGIITEILMDNLTDSEALELEQLVYETLGGDVLVANILIPDGKGGSDFWSGKKRPQIGNKVRKFFESNKDHRDKYSSKFIKDLTGLKFGMWTVIEKTEEYSSINKKGKKTHRKWKCLCDCGNIKSVAGSSLRSGLSKNCVECGHKNRVKTRKYKNNG